MYISSCVIFKNNIKEIQKWLYSVKKYSDEIIAIDTGSEDGTSIILKNAKVAVYKISWQNDFAKAKNFAIEKAKGNWIVFLDTDEYFADHLDIRKILFDINKTNSDTISCRIINIDADNDNAEINRFMQLRIFRNNRGIHYKGKIHEQLRKDHDELKILEKKDIIIYHTGYSDSIYLNKINRNLKIIQENIKKFGENVYYYRYLGDCYYALDNYTESINYYKKHIVSKLYSLENENDIYFNLIDAMIRENYNSKNIFKFIRKAHELFPQHPEFIAQYAALNFATKHYKIAEKAFFKALFLHKKYKNLPSDNFTALLPETYRYLAEIYVYKKEFPKAYLFLNKTLLINKYNYRALHLLCNILQKFSFDILINKLSKYYDETIKDILFLSDHFFNIGMRELFFYYNKILFNKFNIYSEKWRLWSILMNEDKENIFQKLLLQTIEKVQLLSVSLLLMNDLPDKYHDILPQSIWQCLSAYYGKNKLNENDFDAYLTLIPIIAKKANDEILKKYISLGKYFSLDKCYKIFNELYRLEKWECMCFFSSDSIEKYFYHDPEYIFKMGKCAYYNKHFKKAEKYLQESLHNNYNTAETKSFLKWIEDRRDGKW